MSSALKFALVLTIIGARFPSTPILTSETVNKDPKTNPSLHLPNSNSNVGNVGHPASPFGNWNTHTTTVS